MTASETGTNLRIWIRVTFSLHLLANLHLHHLNRNWPSKRVIASHIITCLCVCVCVFCLLFNVSYQVYVSLWWLSYRNNKSNSNINMKPIFAILFLHWPEIQLAYARRWWWSNRYMIVSWRYKNHDINAANINKSATKTHKHTHTTSTRYCTNCNGALACKLEGPCCIGLIGSCCCCCLDSSNPNFLYGCLHPDIVIVVGIAIATLSLQGQCSIRDKTCIQANIAYTSNRQQLKGKRQITQALVATCDSKPERFLSSQMLLAHWTWSHFLSFFSYLTFSLS